MKSNFQNLLLPAIAYYSAIVGLVACQSSQQSDPDLIIRYPPVFNDGILPIEQRDGQRFDFLGRIHKLDTLLSPKSVQDMSTKFSIYTRRAFRQHITFTPSRVCMLGTCHGPYQYDLHAMASSGFNSTARTIIMIAGFLTNDYFGTWLEESKNAWLELDNVNVIIVTWSDSNRYVYSSAVAATPLIARQITIFLYYLAQISQPRFTLLDDEFVNKIHFIGHSLGAHIAGFVGQDLSGRMGRITGLDPAGPSFDMMPRSRRLDSTDALLVDVIHSNAGKIHYLNFAGSAMVEMANSMIMTTPILNRLAGTLTEDYTGEGDTAWYGIDEPVGHVDYYANNGRTQPGCSGILHVCDHKRAHDIYTDILLYELDLSNFQANQSQEARKQSRLIAFNSINYENFQSGNNINQYCPFALGSISTGEDSLKDCSIPIDYVSLPVDFRRELEQDYGIRFDRVDMNPTKFYFKTQDRRPLVGDHNLLKIELDPASKWGENCALKSELVITTPGGEEQVVLDTLNRKLELVKREAFYGLAIPFVNPTGVRGRQILDTLNGQSSVNSSDIAQFNAVHSIMPAKILLVLSAAESSSLLEATKNAIKKVITLGISKRPPKVCNLLVKSIDIQPIIQTNVELSAKYNIMGEKAGKKKSSWFSWSKPAATGDLDYYELSASSPKMTAMLGDVRIGRR